MSTAIALPRHKLSVTDYHQMITTGILTGEDHVELIDGDLIERALAEERIKRIKGHHTYLYNSNSPPDFPTKRK